jgi:YcxB-like protein
MSVLPPGHSRVITFIYHLDQQEHVRAVRLWMRYRRVPPWLRIAPRVLGGLALALLAWVMVSPAAQRGRMLGEYAPVLVLLAGFVWIYRRLMAGGVLRGLMEELPHVDEPVTVTISDESFHLASRWERDTRPWDEIRRVVETPEFLLFIIDEDRAHYLPVHAIKHEGDFAAVRDIIRTHVGARAQLLDGPPAAPGPRPAPEHG